MTAPTLIVMERSGDWAAALRAEFQDRSLKLKAAAPAPRIVETRSLDELWERLRQWPAALVAVELTEANLPSILAALARAEREHPRAAVLVLAERRLAACFALLLEAGAMHCIASPRRLGEAVELLRPRAADDGRCRPRSPRCSPSFLGPL